MKKWIPVLAVLLLAPTLLQGLAFTPIMQKQDARLSLDHMVVDGRHIYPRAPGPSAIAS
jgi:hypothetical protein